MTMAEWDADARQPSLYDICQVLKELRTQVDTFKGKSRKRMTATNTASQRYMILDAI